MPIRKGLEAAACECYRTVKAEYERLLVRRRQRPLRENNLRADNAREDDVRANARPLDREATRGARPRRP